MKAIGGYPELELATGDQYHKEAIRLNTARNCLEYILLAKRYNKVYIPYYTCEAVLQPIKKIPYPISIEYYHINLNLEPNELPELKADEAFLYTNYFGLKQDCVERLSKHYRERLIVDNSQAFFDMPVKGIDTFYSVRKFFGVADGAYLYTDARLEKYHGNDLVADVSYDKMTALLKRIDLSPEDGYEDFQLVENSLSYQPIKFMSKLTETILSSIDYERVRQIRRKNFTTLSWKLFQKNSLALKLREDAVPLCYPFWDKTGDLRKKLTANRIFCPTYWPNVFDWTSPCNIEYEMAKKVIPIPIDQRYRKEDLKRIISVIYN